MSNLNICNSQVPYEPQRMEKVLSFFTLMFFSVGFYFFLEFIFDFEMIYKIMISVIFGLFILKYSHEIIDILKFLAQKMGVIKKW
jgi:hypothetical protein